MARDLATRLKERLQFRHHPNAAPDHTDCVKDYRKDEASCNSTKSGSAAPLLAVRFRECLLLRNRNQHVPTQGQDSETVHGDDVREECSLNSETDSQWKSAVSQNVAAGEIARPLRDNKRNRRVGMVASKPLLEASLEGAWWDVELLGVENEKFLVHYSGYGDRHVPRQLVRHRLRRADDYDCEKFLEPGIDVAVYSIHPDTVNVKNCPAWYDGKLVSIIKKVHSPGCRCEFEVQFYSANEEDLLQQNTQRSLLAGKTRYYHIDNLGILQKPSKGFSVIGTETRSEVKKNWSVDAKRLPYDLIRIENDHRKRVAKIISSTRARSVEDGKGKNFKRARGVDVGVVSGQQEEACLLKLLNVEDGARNPSFQSQSVQYPSTQECGRSQELERERNMEPVVPVVIKEDGNRQEFNERKSNPESSAEINSQNVYENIDNENNANIGESFRPRKRRKIVLKIRSPDQTSIETRMSARNEKLKMQKIRENPRKCRRLYAKAAHSRSINKSLSARTTAYSFIRTQKKYNVQMETNSREGKQKKILTLSSTIDTIILFKRRRWQRKLSILISRGLHKRANVDLQHRPSQLTREYTSAPLHGASVNTAEVSSSKRKRKRKKYRSLKSQHIVEANIDDYKSSFNEFLEKALEKTPSGITKLDWSKLPLRNLANSPNVENAPRRKVSANNQMERSPWNKHGHRQPTTKAKRCNIQLDDLSDWNDLRRLFDERSRMEKTGIQYPDSVQSSRKIPQVPWDPIIFHEEPRSSDSRTVASDLEDNQAEKSDPFEHLLHDMELCLRKKQSSDVKKSERSSMIKDPLSCESGHDFILEQEEGLVCRSCGLVGCSIELMFPPMASGSSRQKVTRSQGDETQLRGNFMDNQLGQAIKNVNGQTCGNTIEMQSSVWDLIPDLKEEMHEHQKDGFEFLWKNLVGSMGPTLQENSVNRETGGCIISHAPGTGKTFLIICFLKSYMKLNPFCRPLILAPTIMLHPWQREFRKWNIDMPIHILNTSNDSSRKATLGEAERLTLPSGSKISTKNVIDLHRMRALVKWHEEGNIGKLLLNSPGLLILDEGHLARNHESKLRKSLKRVKTPLRILLSGTIFQNNCCELFNTFHLVRPTFMKDMFQSQEIFSHDLFYRGRGRPPKGRKGKQAKRTPPVRSGKRNTRKSVIDEDEMNGDNPDKATEDEVESWARRLFMEKIGRTLENGQRKRGKLLENTINRLRSMTQSFVHYYTGEILKSLPGLKDFTILLKPSPVQERLLDEIARVWERNCTIEREYVVSCICIHPYLFKDFFPKYGCSKVDLNKVGELVKDAQYGTKVRFIVELVQLCHVQNEKLLIFSQNITPLDFLEELLLSDAKLLRGEQVKKLHGNLKLDVRQCIIDCFNKPDGNIRVLLASTKACGEGITLTGASRVVFLDIVWNPAVMKQAMSRAFRLGQKKEVFVYRLVASGTLEEEKYKRTIWKDWLSRSIFESSINYEKENTTATAVKDPVIAKVRDPINGCKEPMEDDTMLTTLLDITREDKSILRIVKHDSCLHHGDMSNGDADTEENSDHCV